MSIADKLTQVAENMQRVYDAGKAAGGYSDGYEAGQQAAYDSLWEDLQEGGSRTDYQYAFHYMNAKSFRPKYDLTVKMATCMFRYTNIPGSLGDILNECGVKLIWQSGATGNSVFYGSAFTRLPHIVATGGSLGYYFTSCKNLETIDSIDVTNATASTAFNSTFSGCTALKNLTIVGEISVSGMNVSACPLTHDSLMSIINALQKKTGGTFTVTLGADNLAKLTDAEKAIATGKGWVLA